MVNLCIIYIWTEIAAAITVLDNLEHLYLVPGLGPFGPRVNCPYTPTSPPLTHRLFLDIRAVLSGPSFFQSARLAESGTLTQPVPWKMRLLSSVFQQIPTFCAQNIPEMLLNGNRNPECGEILVNCEFKLNKNLNLNSYRKIPRNSNPIKISIRLCTVRYREI